MNAWAKAGVALAVFLLGGWLLGWQGVIFAMVGVVGWIAWEMVQLTQLMKLAGAAPAGSVADAAALDAALRVGLPLQTLVERAGSLGQRLPGTEKAYAWQDARGHRVEVTLAKGRVAQWRLVRADPTGPAP